MKNSITAVRDRRYELSRMLSSLMEAYRKNNWDRNAVFDELTEMIQQASEDGKMLTSKQIAAMTDGEFSPESIQMYGYWAALSRENEWCGFKPSMPKMERTKVTKVHKFVEVDEKGEIVPDSGFERKTSRYEYFVR